MSETWVNNRLEHQLTVENLDTFDGYPETLFLIDFYPTGVDALELVTLRIEKLEEMLDCARKTLATVCKIRS